MKILLIYIIPLIRGGQKADWNVKENTLLNKTYPVSVIQDYCHMGIPWYLIGCAFQQYFSIYTELSQFTGSLYDFPDICGSFPLQQKRFFNFHYILLYGFFGRQWEMNHSSVCLCTPILISEFFILSWRLTSGKRLFIFTILTCFFFVWVLWYLLSTNLAKSF